PYHGKELPGYFYRAKAGGIRRPTLIVVGGIETFAEDLYFMVAPAALRRGFNVLAVDLPGQGLNPAQKLYLEARSDRAVRAVVDYAVAHPEVDTGHLALFGFSWGGHIALKGAVNEPRIKALIANPATHNMFSSALAQQSSNGRGDPVVRLVFQQLAWRFGLSLGNLPARLVRAVEFLLYARADVRQILCPALCMAGESEAKVTLEQTRQTYERLPNPRKRLAILTKELGGAAHCQVDNLELLNRVIFDWLDEVWASIS
ncbi:MAG: alpha/beta hydrolase family protein, partial [Nitrososphaerales archaeon]